MLFQAHTSGCGSAFGRQLDETADEVRLGQVEGFDEDGLARLELGAVIDEKTGPACRSAGLAGVLALVPEETKAR